MQVQVIWVIICHHPCIPSATYFIVVYNENLAEHGEANLEEADEGKT
jgi:hypothetical protein